MFGVGIFSEHSESDLLPVPLCQMGSFSTNCRRSTGISLQCHRNSLSWLFYELVLLLHSVFHRVHCAALQSGTEVRRKPREKGHARKISIITI